MPKKKVTSTQAHIFWWCLHLRTDRYWKNDSLPKSLRCAFPKEHFHVYNIITYTIYTILYYTYYTSCIYSFPWSPRSRMWVFVSDWTVLNTFLDFASEVTARRFPVKPLVKLFKVSSIYRQTNTPPFLILLQTMRRHIDLGHICMTKSNIYVIKLLTIMARNVLESPVNAIAHVWSRQWWTMQALIFHTFYPQSI